jgi:hypothetical protein
MLCSAVKRGPSHIAIAHEHPKRHRWWSRVKLHLFSSLSSLSWWHKYVSPFAMSDFSNEKKRSRADLAPKSAGCSQSPNVVNPDYGNPLRQLFCSKVRSIQVCAVLLCCQMLVLSQTHIHALSSLAVYALWLGLERASRRNKSCQQGWGSTCCSFLYTAV